jgi:hypothetical protein
MPAARRSHRHPRPASRTDPISPPEVSVSGGIHRRWVPLQLESILPTLRHGSERRQTVETGRTALVVARAAKLSRATTAPPGRLLPAAE